jgi:outer membrane protein OmpA-like peptidoglycan-associated protein
MNSTLKRLNLVGTFAVVALGLSLPLFGQSPGAQTAAPQQAAAQTASGEKIKVEGVILKREGDTLTLRDSKGVESTVAFNNNTRVKEKESNPLRLAKTFTTSQLQRGLYIEVEGRKDGSRVLADRIRFKEDYIKVAASVESLVVPVETRLTATETRLSESEKNAQRLSGQIQEVSSISTAARGAARAAQDTADQANLTLKSVSDSTESAKAGVRVTNERISALDDYEIKTSAVVSFKIGSAVLSDEAKSSLDKLAEEAGRQKGFVIEVTGFASSDGDAGVNKKLSERRASAVVDYLAENHSVPLRRIVMPMGFGEAKPAADNGTREGRQQNRRVEVKVLVSKGLAQSGQN